MRRVGGLPPLVLLLPPLRSAAVEALIALKSPTEFLALQQKLIKDGLETAASDSRRIAELTTAVFTAAFDPVKKQIEAAQHKAKIS